MYIDLIEEKVQLLPMTFPLKVAISIPKSDSTLLIDSMKNFHLMEKNKRRELTIDIPFHPQSITHEISGGIIINSILVIESRALPCMMVALFS